MNRNGHGKYLDHAIAIRQQPELRAKLQTELNTWRRKRLMEAATVRPVFLPLQFTMTAAAQVSPYRRYTKSLGYDVIILGVKADVQTRDIIVRRTDSEAPLTHVGDEVDLNLRVDDLAGISATVGGGQTGTFYLTAPITLKKGERISVEMFKTDATAGVEIANIVLVGVRAYNRAFGEDLIDPVESQLIDRYIAARETPTTKFLKVPVAFDSAIAGGIAENVYTPKVEEPLLIKGIRTTLRQSTIELGIEGEPSLTYEATPIWAVAGEDELVHENYNWFSKPLYLHSNTVVEIRRIVNSIDGSLIDAQTGNTITFICETV